MNIITVNTDIFSVFQKGQMVEIYKPYLNRLIRKGEVAFDDFIVHTQLNNKDVYIRFWFANLGESVCIEIATDLVNCNRGTYMHYIVGLKHGANGIMTNFYVINPFTGNADAMRPNWYLSHVLVPFFAKIQVNALKCKKNIIRLGKSIKTSSCEHNANENEQSNKTIILCPGITYSISTEVPRHFTRHCEAWMVRGHYRKYKSGKTVYIKPYQKGKGKLKQTNYELRKET